MYNSMRITGLASGIDTEEMIQQLMQAERIKVDRVEQDKQVSVWRQEMYNDLNKDFANFILNTRKMFGLTSVTSKGAFVSNSYQNLNWVKKATSSNETIATVSSTGKAMDGNYKVDVTQLAEGVSLASGDNINGKGSIRDMLGAEFKDQDRIEFEINGKKFVIGNIEKDENGNLTGEGITAIKNGNQEVIGYEEAIIDGDLGSIKLNSVVKLINSAKIEKDGKEVSLGVRASYDSGIDRFFLQTTETGENAKIKITSTDTAGKAFINTLKLTDGGKSKNGDTILDYEFKGKDAIVNFNGADGITSSTNRMTINGITMDLTGAGEFNVNVATDVDGVYEKIEQFVNEYNELVDKTNKLLGEKQYRDYKPLTSDQRKAMEKEDIELWEEKAKSGLLRNDDIIGRTMLNTRRSLYELPKEGEINGAYKLLTEIGIGTQKYARGSAGGKLVIDEEKLKSAIANDPEGVMELMFKESTPDKKDPADENKTIKGTPGGILARVHDNLMIGMEEMIKKSGTGENAELYRGVKSNILLDFVSSHSSISLLDKDVIQYNRKIDDLNTMLFRKENHYYAKFAAMEKAISRMNQQSAWLTQQFAG